MTALTNPRFPRSNGYDEAWVLDGIMGPNPLWLAEWLGEVLALEEGSRVLDLGCGKALSSVFFAREYGASVIAADLWVPPDDNWATIQRGGADDRVLPVLAEAHSLPFAAGYFDAITCIDAYHYFGTDALYLHYLSRFLRPGGTLGVVVPGLMKPLPTPMPTHLVTPQSNGHVFWESECSSFETAEWWHQNMSKCDRMEILRVDTLEDGWRHWRDHERAIAGSSSYPFPSVEETLQADEGEYLGFVRATARRIEGEGIDLYEPKLAARFSSP